MHTPTPLSEDVGKGTSHADDQSTATTTTTTASSNAMLLASLSKQLDYYFSCKNLSKDTYLKTIMDLNSGHVPVSIISNFANVNRIISTSSTHLEDDLRNTDVECLVRQAAIQSDLIKVVRLNQNGKVVSQFDENDFTSMKKVDYKPLPEDNGKPTFVAIGPSPLLISKNNEGGQLSDTENKDLEEESKMQQTPVSTSASNNSCNMIILRDVPEAATEDDIRSIFQSDEQTQSKESIVTNAQREFGQCWFVTLSSETSQQDVYDILLNLRNKHILKEPVKARLKTQSIIANSENNSPLSSPASIGAGNMPSYNPNHSFNSRNKTPIYRNNSNHIYSGDRMYYSTRKHYSGGSRNGASYATNGKFKHNRFNSRHGSSSSSQFPSSNKGKLGAGNDESEKKEPNNVQAPPPLVDEHYPSLGGQSPKSTIVPTEEQAEERDGKPSVSDEQRLESVETTPVTKSNVGYAAAVLKAIPQNNPIGSGVVSPSNPFKDESKGQQKNSGQKSNDHKSESTKAHTMSTATDDLSSDDKSSLSSRPESEKGVTTHTVSPSTQVVVGYEDASKKWGGGRSFADILKRQET